RLPGHDCRTAVSAFQHPAPAVEQEMSLLLPGRAVARMAVLGQERANLALEEFYLGRVRLGLVRPGGGEEVWYANEQPEAEAKCWPRDQARRVPGIRGRVHGSPSALCLRASERQARQGEYTTARGLRPHRAPAPSPT